MPNQNTATSGAPSAAEGQQAPKQHRRRRRHRGRGQPRAQAARLQPAPPVDAGAEVKPAVGFKDAIKQLERIRTDLENVVEEIREALELLEQVAQDQGVSQAQTEQLRRTVRSLQRG